MYRQIAEDLREQVDLVSYPRAAACRPNPTSGRRTTHPATPSARTPSGGWSTSAWWRHGRARGTSSSEVTAPFVTFLGLDDPYVDETDSANYVADVADAGRVPESALRVELLTANKDVANELRIPRGSRVISRQQRRHIDGKPWSLQTTFLPVELADRGAGRLLEPQDIAVVRYIAETLGTRQAGWRDRIAVRSPDPAEATFFSLSEDGSVPVFEIQRTACDANGVPLRLTVTVYPADRNRFVLSPDIAEARARVREGRSREAGGSTMKPSRHRTERADQAESGARRALAQRAFDEAVELLRQAVALDPGRAGRLQPDLDCLSGRPRNRPAGSPGGAVSGWPSPPAARSNCAARPPSRPLRRSPSPSRVAMCPDHHRHWAGPTCVGTARGKRRDA